VLQNDKLTLHINGAAVAEHTVAAPPTSRFFGLFRYITDTKCRVRNIVYRGDWPKQLPKLEQQQLAYPADGPFLVKKELVQESLNLPLNRPVDQLQQDGISILGSDDGISTAENGLRLHAKQENGEKTQVGLTLEKSLPGDFEATLNFAELTLQSNQENGETGFTMLVAFDDPAKSVIELGMFLDHHGKHSVRTICEHQLPDGDPTQVDSQFSQTVTAGQLRILRRGNQLHCLLGDQENHFRLLKATPLLAHRSQR